MKICALASGSKGNSVYVGTAGHAVLIDAGLSASSIRERIESAGLSPESLRAVLLTHEHNDHARGAGVVARKYRIPVYATEGTIAAVERHFGADHLKGVEVRVVEADIDFEVAGMSFTPFSTSHDAEDSLGFCVTDGKITLGFATDLGVHTQEVRGHLCHANVLYIESNHDLEMLENGPYPRFLKKRIRSAHGHLSNVDCADLVEELIHQRLKAVVLAHLSETNNTPRIAYDNMRELLVKLGAEDDVNLLVARQDRAGSVIK